MPVEDSSIIQNVPNHVLLTHVIFVSLSHFIHLILIGFDIICGIIGRIHDHGIQFTFSNLVRQLFDSVPPHGILLVGVHNHGFLLYLTMHYLYRCFTSSKAECNCENHSEWDRTFTSMASYVYRAYIIAPNHFLLVYKYTPSLIAYPMKMQHL